MSAAQGPVRQDRAGGVLTLTLERPEAGNAMDQPLVDAFHDAVLAAVHDASVRCVVVTGAGRMFCVGGDIGAMQASGGEIGPFLTRLAGRLHAALALLAGMDKPLVTLVNGPAAGAGMSLALLGDIALAAPEAHFTAGYGGIGLTPDGGMSWLLPRLVGMRRAQEILLTNARVTAEEAARIGLLTRTVAAGALAAEGAALAERLAAGPVRAMGAARRLLHASFDSGFSSQMDREAAAIAAAGTSAEGREGVAAFIARRKPDFITGA